jgi:hypothetical protein
MIKGCDKYNHNNYETQAQTANMVLFLEKVRF